MQKGLLCGIVFGLESAVDLYLKSFFVALFVRQQVNSDWYNFLFKGVSLYLTDIIATVDFGQMSVRYYLLDILSYFKKMRTKDSFLACKNLDLAFGVGFQFVGQNIDVSLLGLISIMLLDC